MKVHLFIRNLREATIFHLVFEDCLLVLLTTNIGKKTLRILMVNSIDEGVCLIVYSSLFNDNLLNLTHQVVNLLNLLQTRIIFAVISC